MTLNVTAGDVLEIELKLASNEENERFDGVRLLNTWLEGERSIEFCNYLSKNSQVLKTNDTPQSKTWAYLVKILTTCISLEISSSKERLPKLSFAKTLRNVVQRAHDAFPGKNLFLLPVAELIFDHVWDVLKVAVSLSSEYSLILQHLLANTHYRFHMRTQVYADLVSLHIKKVEEKLSTQNISWLNSGDDVYRLAVTLQLLLQSPPGDIHDDLREEIIKGFLRIISYIQNEGKVSRKLLECINTFLVKDGPNLGDKCLDIYDALKQFFSRCWVETRDCSHKDSLVLYAKLQLSLIRSVADGTAFVEQLMSFLCKELDQMSSSSTMMPRDEKLGSLTSSQYSMVKLAALVFSRACSNTSRVSIPEKQARLVPHADLIKERLVEGKWPWYAVFFFLIDSYSSRLGDDLFMYWFENISANFKRMINTCNSDCSYDGLLWILRSLQKLSSSLLFAAPSAAFSRKLSAPMNEVEKGWHVIWSCIMDNFPAFINVSSVVDAALMLLGNILMSDTRNSYFVSLEFWDLQVFKCLPSISVLCFISCYFSRRASQCNPQDALCIRHNMLRAVLAPLSLKEYSPLDASLIVAIPAAAYALCVGSTPLLKEALELSQLHFLPEDMEEVKTEEQSPEHPCDFFECSVEFLTKIEKDSSPKVNMPEYNQRIKLSRSMRNQLVKEMEDDIIECMKSQESEIMLLSDVINRCALLSNVMYASYSTSVGGGTSGFFLKLTKLMLELLERAISVVETACKDIVFGGLGFNATLHSMGFTLVSFQSFANSPFIKKWQEINSAPLPSVVIKAEKLLEVLADLYEKCSWYTTKLDANPDLTDILDICSEDDDPVPQLTMILSIMSSFFAILPSVTWETLSKLKAINNNPKVSEYILSILCRYCHVSSDSQLLDLVGVIAHAVDVTADLKFQNSHVLSAICGLVESLLGTDDSGKQWSVSSSSKKPVSEVFLVSLGDLVKKVVDKSYPYWFDRIKIINCICNFISFHPEVAQSIGGKLVLLLQDPDYRVRCCLAERISVLFQACDDHCRLFHIICTNFSMKLVNSASEKIVKAEEVLAAGSTPGIIVETTVKTLLHLVLHSDRIELEAVFMICAVAAIEPSQRELVRLALDSISKQLSYTNRVKYMEELMGPILFKWVTCEVSLTALVQTRELFVLNIEAHKFVQHCGQWLLPALILLEDDANLKWMAETAQCPCADFVILHYVHIISVCMASECSNIVGCRSKTRTWKTSILKVCGITEGKRDELIKKHMVSILKHIISLASMDSEPQIPLFSKDTIARAIQTAMRDFMDSEAGSRTVNPANKIHILTPNEVFQFLVSIHYRAAVAAHHRHKYNHLVVIGVFVDLLGPRSCRPSIFIYLLNLIGQFIDFPFLTDQCCDILSKLLKASNDNPSPNTTRLLGEQLQYLVSKLVDCCIRFESCGMLSSTASSQAFLLLQQLVTGSEASLHEYIKELGPFPEIDIFDGLRQFHSVICSTYSPRAHLLNLVKRASHVPSRFLLGSLKALHKQLLKKGMHLEEENNVDVLKNECWHSDGQIVQAAWGLVEMCSLDDANNLRSIVIDLICRAGIGDPHGVVFRLPGESPMHAPKTYKRITDKQYKHSVETAMSEKSLLALMILLKKCLMDESVEIIDKASHALCGILSSMNGNKAFNMLDPYEMSLIEAHSGGVDLDLVKESITNLERKFSARPISIEDSTTWTTSGKTFDEWICPLVYAIINYCDDPILRLCQDIVLAKSEVAELLFINAIVDVSKRDPSIGLCKIISSKVQENIFTESNALIKSVQIFLRALNELRLYVDHEFGGKPTSLFLIQKSKRAKVPGCEFKSRIASVESKNVPHSGVSASINWNKVYWLDVDYLLAANFAVDCGSYLTAVLYVELWCEEHFKSLSLGTDFYRHEKLQLHIEILLSAVTQINEPDSLYGLIQSPKLTSQIVTFEQEGNWGKALEYYDMKMRLEPILQIASSSHSSLESSQLHTGLIRSLKQTGCNHVLGVYCQGLASQRGPFKHDSEFTELQYEAAWRAGNWDFCPNSGADAEASYQHARGHHFHQNLHSCFRAFQEGEFDEFHARLQDSKQDLLLSICHASQESTQFIHSTTIKLQIFYHLGMAWDLRWSSSHEKTDSLSELTIPGDQLQWLHGHWRCILKQAELHLDVLEPLIAFRRVLLQALNSVESTLHHLLESASILRKGSRFSQSAAALFELKSLCSEGDKHSNMYWLGRVFEESKLYHAQGQHEMAINLADHISQTNLLKPSAPNIFTLIGKWRAETRSSNSRIILDKYLQKAIDEDNNATNKVSVEKKNQMHFQLAHYVDGLFRNHEERLNSKEWQIAESLQDRKEKEIKALANACKSVKGNTTEYLLMIQQLQKQVEMGKEEKDKLEQDMDKLLCSALEGYKRCLIIGEKYDVRAVFRLVSLWFRLSNRKIVVDCMRSTIKEVQSYKFLLLVYQIVSRLGADTDSINFQRVLASLVMKMALDHPYHTLYQLIALTNGDRIKPQQKSKIFFVADMCTKFAAESLLKEISQRHGVILHQMQRMIEVYIKVAELEMNAGTNGKILLPAHLRDLGPFEHVPVITYDVPVDRTCQYPESSFPHFKGMSSSITRVGGINAPKLVECFGSDGNKYLQLSKSGNDDLRQDAVMEQLFGLVNTFLLENNDTRKRRLKIRTYKVVPLTPSAGVLEWVNGTSKLSEYLIGRTESGVSGAHGHYGVGDWEFKECRKHMTEEADKRKAFEKVCQNFRPVMHYFFLERFSNPAVWFEKRNAYTRSVAASSMVGYIVGLGDRHLGNILIDETTAEVVHIDLGIAFEQGLLLRTPERVPFRLTRDIVDGMGVTGVEGVFRRCCEETLSVMRRNKEALLTIIEVFIHDPLYKWALSPLKALLLEKVITNSQYDALDDSDEGNRDAVRALTRVKQKLDGYEDGEMRSVKGQVQQLIQDATDPDRLCTIYVGWASWV